MIFGDDAKFGYPDAMVLRLSTQKGESGGPLFDQRGDLVGMVVSTLYDNAGQPLNLAHAVPSRTLAGFLCGNVAVLRAVARHCQRAGGALRLLEAVQNRRADAAHRVSSAPLTPR